MSTTATIWNEKAVYFTHSVRMRKNLQIQVLRAKFGWGGFGIWCAILEILGENNFEIHWDSENVEMFEIMQVDLSIEEELLRGIIDFCLARKLFVVEDGILYSPAQKRFMQPFLEMREKRGEAGKKAAEKRWEKEQTPQKSKRNKQKDNTICDGNANALATQCEPKGNNRLEYTRVQYTREKEKERVLSNSKEKPSENFRKADFCQGDFSEGGTETDPQPKPQGENPTPIPYPEIEAAWNAQRGDLPSLQGLSETRRAKIKSRWAKIKSRWAEFGGDPMATYKALLGKIRASRFLQGKTGKWRAKFDWLFENDTNWRKVLEGQYDDPPAAPSAPRDARLGAGEYLENGERYYRSLSSGDAIHVPADAPPRPDTESVWDLWEGSWHHAF